MGSKSGSGPALIPKLSVGGNSTGNAGPAVRAGKVKGNLKLFRSYSNLLCAGINIQWSLLLSVLFLCFFFFICNPILHFYSILEPTKLSCIGCRV